MSSPCKKILVVGEDGSFSDRFGSFDEAILSQPDKLDFDPGVDQVVRVALFHTGGTTGRQSWSVSRTEIKFMPPGVSRRSTDWTDPT